MEENVRYRVNGDRFETIDNENIRVIRFEIARKRKSGNQMLKVKVDLSSSAFDFDF